MHEVINDLKVYILVLREEKAMTERRSNAIIIFYFFIFNEGDEHPCPKDR